MEKEEKQKEYLIYAFLLSTLLIFIESLKTYFFNVNNYLISFSIPFIPFVFLVTNIIKKKFGLKKSILSIFISLFSTIIFIIVIAFAMKKQLDFNVFIGEIISYTISQLLNLFIFKVIESNKKDTYIIVFLSYIFSIILFHMIYTLSYLNTTILDGFWNRYIINISIETIICIPLSIIYKKIK